MLNKSLILMLDFSKDQAGNVRTRYACPHTYQLCQVRQKGRDFAKSQHAPSMATLQAYMWCAQTPNPRLLWLYADGGLLPCHQSAAPLYSHTQPYVCHLPHTLSSKAPPSSCSLTHEQRTVLRLPCAPCVSICTFVLVKQVK